MVRVGSRLFLSTAALIALAAAPAAGIEVSNLNDAGAGSLRQAILDANLNPGADVITFQPSVTGTILLTTGEIAITDSVDIQGPGARSLAVDSTARIFTISGSTSVTVVISGLTLTGGQAAGNGGAIANAGANVTLRFVTVSGNNATAEGGAIFHNANSGWLTHRKLDAVRQHREQGGRHLQHRLQPGDQEQHDLRQPRDRQHRWDQARVRVRVDLQFDDHR